MAATFDDVERWKEEGRSRGAIHIICVCDTFDWEDYPVYVMPGENLEKRKSEFDRINMQKINEVIDLLPT